MLSIRLQGGAAEHEPSAAGTLRLLTAAHARPAAPAPRLLLHHAHVGGHPHHKVRGDGVLAEDPLGGLVTGFRKVCMRFLFMFFL